MAKMRTKEIIPEKTPQKCGTDSYSYEKACNAAKNSGTPTYRFAVGDRVQVGQLPNCVVEEVMDDGAMYLIRITTTNHVEYSCWAWTSVRPLDDDKDTHTDAEGKTQEIQFEISHECAYGTAVRKLIGKFNEFCKENNLTLDSLT